MILFVALISCKETSEEANSKKQPAPSKNRVVKLDGQKLPDRLLTLNTESNPEALAPPVTGNLFGKFFLTEPNFTS